jgi:hypothetical protein
LKFIKRIVIVLVVILVGIQFIPTTHNQSDEVSETDFIKAFSAPNNIKMLLKTSCYDCHSNNTKYPWYDKIQPLSWLLEDHINNGKEELNFSEFGLYSKRKQKSKLKSIISQIKDNEMPLSSYTILHSKAKLSKNDKKLIMDWFLQLKDSI